MVMTEIDIIIAFLIWFVIGFVSMYLTGRYLTGKKIPKEDWIYIFFGGLMGLVSTGLCIISIILAIVKKEFDKIRKDI